MTGTFEDAVRAYADKVAAKFTTPIDAQDEDALKAPVGDLLSAVGGVWNIETQWRPEARAEGDIGRPDLGITAGGLLCGHIELKAPGRGARPEGFRRHDRDQWNRFQALPNLIYTDGSEWSLYRGGKRIARVRIAADVSDEGAAGLDATAVSKLEGLLRDFLMHEPVTPSTARGVPLPSVDAPGVDADGEPEPDRIVVSRWDYEHRRLQYRIPHEVYPFVAGEPGRAMALLRTLGVDV